MRTLKSAFPFENVFPAVFKGIMPAMQWDEALPPSIRLDVEEAEKAYTVKAEIPGVKKEEIFVDVDGAAVTLRAEVRREVPETREGSMLHSERFYGTLSRTFMLPTEVEADAATAKYDNGVLWLTLPKKGGAATHRVTIN
jgi:HSP20 family protein